MDRKFQLVDAAYCFLSRNRATLSAKNVAHMASSLSGEAVSVADLHRMAAIAPALMTLDTAQQRQLQHRDDVFLGDSKLTPEELDIVCFLSVPQASQRATTKRIKLFAAALKAADASILATAEQQEEEEQQQAPVVSARPQPPEPEQDKLPAEASMPSPSCPWIQMLRSLDLFDDQIVHVETRAARSATYVPLASLALPPAVSTALSRVGITQLYSHQYEAIQATLRGDNVVLSTSTASGKSMTFTVPTLASLLEDPQATFMYLFPTKALAQDQLKSLRRFLHAAGLPQHLCSTFDGDTPMKSRSMVIRETKIFLTNPDIMHLTILPKHTQWKSVLANLKLLVVDEAHMYRGIFGSHVASVFRRLFRLCALHGSNPRIICCSATTRNPKAHFRMLFPRLPPKYEPSPSPTNSNTISSPQQTTPTTTQSPAQFDFFYERPLQIITQDGSPTGEKIFCVWNPKAKKYNDDEKPVRETATVESSYSGGASHKRKRTELAPSPTTATIRAANEAKEDDNTKRITTSPIFQTAAIFARLVEAKIHTLLFCRGRKLSELMLMTVHSILKKSADTKQLVNRVHTYRGGYSSEDRRKIERRLSEGDLIGVIATNALELGIDIGELDCTMHLGLPASISSLWQQAGRAGRKHTQQSLSVIVCFDSPLDQHFARHAADLFLLQPEAVKLNPDNNKIVGPHLLCAAHEHALFDARSGLAYVDSFVFGTASTAATRDSETQTSTVMALIKSHTEQQHLTTNASGTGGFQLHSCAPKSLREVNLRSISEIQYQVVNEDDHELRVLDEIPGERVFFQVYPTAVYLHQAQEYIITKLDIDQKIAFARRCPQLLTYFTTCRDYTEVDIVKIHRRTTMTAQQPQPQQQQVGDDDSAVDTTVVGAAAACAVCQGLVSVTTSVFGATLVEKTSMRVLSTNEFSLPLMQAFGHALWVELPHALRKQVEDASFVWTGALHGVGHLLLAVVPLFVLCDAGDINTEHYNPFEQRVRPNRVTIYERRDGGSGIVEEIARCLPEIVRRAWLIARECECLSGCPACIHSSQCTEYNKVLDKRGSLLVLQYLASCYHEQLEMAH